MKKEVDKVDEQACDEVLKGMTFNHEKLEVYNRALIFNAWVSEITSEWESKHSIQDQLSRAASSIIENIAMGSATYSGMKEKSLDYALGSTLECAACLDIAAIKNLLNDPLVRAQKDELCQLLKMLIGLRRSWARRQVREGRTEYGVKTDAPKTNLTHEADCEHRSNILFHHEELDVYQTSLQAFSNLACIMDSVCMPAVAFRRLDILATSMVLNIAEGNGRFSVLDQSRFLNTSHESAVKLAARLDLCVAQKLLPDGRVEELKGLLLRVSSMLMAMINKGSL